MNAALPLWMTVERDQDEVALEEAALVAKGQQMLESLLREREHPVNRERAPVPQLEFSI